MTERTAKLKIEGSLEALGYKKTDGIFVCGTTKAVVGDRLLVVENHDRMMFSMFLGDVLSVEVCDGGLTVVGTSFRLSVPKEDWFDGQAAMLYDTDED